MLHFASLVEAVVGIALVAGGAAGLNQIYERDTDSLMFRTRMRPLAAQRVTTNEALIFSLALVGDWPRHSGGHRRISWPRSSRC